MGATALAHNEEYVRCVARGTHSERTESGLCAECGFDEDTARETVEFVELEYPRRLLRDRMWEGRRGRVVWRVAFPGVGGSRLGGGWKWKLGAQGGGRTLILYLLIVTVRLDL